jgi:hypothetical protein
MFLLLKAGQLYTQVGQEGVFYQDVFKQNQKCGLIWLIYSGFKMLKKMKVCGQKAGKNERMIGKWLVRKDTYILNRKETERPSAWASSGSINGPSPICTHAPRESFCRFIVSPFNNISSSWVVLLIGVVFIW